MPAAQATKVTSLIGCVDMVIAVNGGAIEGDGNLLSALAKIAEVISDGKKVLIVHGGRPQISDCLSMQGTTSTFVNDLRVTDDAAMSAVFAGAAHVNSQIVARLKSLGIDAVGLHAEPSLLTCKKKVLKSEAGETVQLGWVGDIVRTDVSVLTNYLDKTIVISNIGTDGDKNRYNLSVEEVAQAIADAFDCDLCAVKQFPVNLKCS